MGRTGNYTSILEYRESKIIIKMNKQLAAGKKNE